MYMFVTFLVLCLGLSAYGDLSTRIVGGKDVLIGKYPFQVSLRKRGEHTCGGSIIDKRHILTAAHCSITVKLRSGLWKAHVGTSFRNESGTVYEIENIFRHENYNRTERQRDIAVVRVKKDIEFNDNVKPIPLATTDFVQPGDTVVAIGWGRLARGGKISNSLQKVALNVTTLERCNRPYQGVSHLHICTSTSAGKGTCVGDSGGPLVMNGIQIGIVSFGVPCAVGMPDVFTKVYPYQKWIAEKVKLIGH